MKELADNAARERIRDALDVNLVVEAAAGTGKTTELINRVIAVLRSGRAEVGSLVAVTFTEKAAGELKLRLRAGLEEARQREAPGGPERGYLEAALARLEEARVSTIHGFCADLLRERPVEARVDPRFRVATEGEAEQLYAEAFGRWLQERLEDPPEGVRRSLRRESKYDDGPTDRLRSAGWMLATWRDFRAAWRRDPFDREAEIDALVTQLHDFAAMTKLCANPDRDGLYVDTVAARRLDAEIRRIETVRERDYDWLEAKLVALGTDGDFRRARKGFGRFFAKDIERGSVQSAYEEVRAALERFSVRADADLAPVLQQALFETVERYEALKQRAGVLDFVDLLLRARNLVRDSEAVRAELQGRFTHLFVDEFQDTDPLQAEILLLLAGAEAAVRDWREVHPIPGKLFIVGDPKQSIYRFRRADVGTYVEVRDLLLARGAERVQLTTSFRALPSIQRVVNAAFAPLMREDKDALQAEYVPLAPYRAERADQPTIIALPVPRPYGVRNVTKTAIEESLPDATGAFVQWLLSESEWEVAEGRKPDGSEKLVPIAARHVCLLFRRFDSFFTGDITRGYIKALEARNIPSLLVGGKSFHSREEVETMRAALTAVEWPDDQLSVFATLHGSLFAIGDAALLEYRHRYGRFHPFRIPKEPLADHLAPIADALSLLASLHRGRNQRPIAETVALLLEATRAHAGFALRPAGEQVLANVLHVGELAQAYESGGGISFRAFAEQLGEEAARSQTAEAPILEEGSDGVRIMTTHKAKGLEFPVVILADITARATGGVSRWVDAARGLCALRIAGWSPIELGEHAEAEAQRDAAEGLRVAYVAATRARDLLVVPTVGDTRFDNGWVSALNSAVYPKADAANRSREAPGCPKFGPSSVVERPPERAFDSEGVRPGLHLFEEADYGVVWWDPNLLSLDAPAQFGIRQRHLLGEKKVAPETVQADVARFRTWQAAKEAAVAGGSRPSLNVYVATDPTAPDVGELPKAQMIILPRDPARPAGPRFGALVHAALATTPLASDRSRIVDAVALQGRVLGAAADEVESAVDVVENALGHPLLKRALAAQVRGKCRRETPVILRTPDGAIVEGVVDLAFEEDGAWIVVDFKTDVDLAGRLEPYERQVGLYAAAIGAATGMRALPILLRV